MAARVSGEEFEEKVLKAELPVLLEFYSDSCIPCKLMSGPLADIEEEYAGKLLVYKVNVNFEEALAKQYEVLAAPTLLVIQNGEEKARRTGAAKKPEIIEFMEAYI